VSDFQFDLLVVGAGSGGVRAGRMAAGFGAKVGIIEDRYMGGTCVNVGCVPKKLYAYAAHYHEDFKDAEGFGWSKQSPSFDWAVLREQKVSEISRLNGIYRNMLGNAGCTLIDGRGRIVDNHHVEVNGETYSAERILVATGGWPRKLGIPGEELAITSNEFFDLPSFPNRVLVVGGGYIATEFAGILNGLGASVKQVYRGELFMRGFDLEVRNFLAQEVRKKGVDLVFNSNPASIEAGENGYAVTFEDGSSETFDCVVAAVGRVPNTEGLGLENTDVTFDQSGYIKVNESYQTEDSSVYAVGDIIGGMELTPVALAEGMKLANELYNSNNYDVDYEFIPTAVFSLPNVGTIGFSEEEARDEFGDIQVFVSEFRALKHTLSGSDERTLMKLIVEAKTDRVVGLHMVGAEAGEICQGFAVAMKAGATKAMFDTTIGIHPTSAEEFVTMRSMTRT